MEQQLNRVFDRVASFDERSRNYPITLSVQENLPLRSMSWPRGPVLNQRKSGGCMAFAAAGELACGPVAVPGITDEFATKQLYWPAQRADEFRGGEYPGASRRMQGTSMIAILKRLVAIGACDSYQHSFKEKDTYRGIGYNGPCLIGTNCYHGMMCPDAKGFLHPTGKYLGGHGMLLPQICLEQEYVVVRMAWDDTWGNHGEAKLTFKDYNQLRREMGEAAFLVGRHMIDVAALPPEIRRSWWARLFGG
jgi:hypothetical protein